MEYEKNATYAADHKPSGETWHIVGIDTEGDRVCAAGWPPTITKLSDCENFRDPQPITDDELEFRCRYFPSDSWI